MSSLVGKIVPLSYPALRDDAFGRIETALDKLFNEALSPSFAQKAKENLYPKTNIVRKGERGLEFQCAVPFVKREDISVELQGGHLKISGKSSHSDANKDDYLCREIPRSQFYRAWELGDHIQPGDISAEVKEGVLYVTVNNAFRLKDTQNKNVIEIK